MSQFSIYLRVTDHPPTIESKVRDARPEAFAVSAVSFPSPAAGTRRCYRSACFACTMACFA